MAVARKQSLEFVLEELGLISKPQVELIKIESVRSGKPIEQVIKELKLITDENLVKAKAITLRVPYVDLTAQKLRKEVLKLIPFTLAKDYQSVAFGLRGADLNVAMLDPTNVQVLDYLEKKLGRKLHPYMASGPSIAQCLSQYEGSVSQEVRDVLKTVEVKTASAPTDGTKIRELMEDAPVTRAVNTILESAIKSRASDIHIEPKDNDLRVRYRIDGILHEVMSLPKNIHPAIISRIKILSNLKIDEHRTPQDGQFEIKTENSDVDVRVSISPLISGEKVVMRLLNKDAGTITLDELGLRGHAYALVKASTKSPHGMILTTGPTGSGKSTTLFAILKEINVESTNIITVEDPVEYHIDGVNQIQVNTQVGLTFASALRSILRQDPNIIMVGEIRDAETADLAIQAALTGHVVLSTLHTNSSAGILPRLIDMNIEPYLIASTISTGMGQRLVRKICPNCKYEFAAPAAAVVELNKSLGRILPGQVSKNAAQIFKDLGYDSLPYFDPKGYTLYKGKGCDQCAGTGYQGRIAIFEVFNMSSALEQLLLTHPTTTQVQNLTVAEGMVTLKQDGFLKALAGITTLDEVYRVAADY